MNINIDDFLQQRLTELNVLIDEMPHTTDYKLLYEWIRQQQTELTELLWELQHE